MRVAQSSGGSGQYSTLIFLALMGAVFYFLLIRPQQRNRRRQAQLLSSLEEGDEVQTIGGIFGTIREIDEGDGTVLLEVAPEVEAAARRAGFLVNAVLPDAIRLAPPLILSAAEAEEFTAALPRILDEAGS